MRLVVFGLTISSSWGNGHATLWRGLVRALTAAGHRVVFFERDVPYYAQNRDLTELPAGADIVLYDDFADVVPTARRAVADSDAAIVTSYCPDAVQAARLVQELPRVVRCFYDLDTPVTLSRLDLGVDYIGPDGLASFDLVLSYTGGPALDALQRQLGARRVVPLYGWVDAARYVPSRPRADVTGLMTHLGTYAADRHAALETLLIAPARALPHERFVIGGAQYPEHFPWTDNIWFVRHVPPADHPAFYASGRLTLNVTRAAMARMGWCPSGRMFEAAACGAPILSDAWPGIETFFTPGEEILLASSTEEALAALATPPDVLRALAARARERVLDEHTAERRMATLLSALDSVHAEAA